TGMERMAAHSEAAAAQSAAAPAHQLFAQGSGLEGQTAAKDAGNWIVKFLRSLGLETERDLHRMASHSAQPSTQPETAAASTDAARAAAPLDNLKTWLLQVLGSDEASP